MHEPAEVDLNADLGESFGRWRLGDDEALLDIVTSANVACGFHAGDPSTMHRVCARAAERGVAIGAQVGYRDLAGFGRRFLDVSPDDLRADVLYQLGALDGIARAAGTRVRYLKPHGALYHRCVTDEAQASAVLAAVRDYDPGLPVLGFPGSALLATAAASGLRAVPEAFADRAYSAEGHLVPRERPGSVLHDVETITTRVVRLAREAVIDTADGSLLATAARSICVHGDTPGAVAIADAVRRALAAAGVTLRAFA